MKVMLTFLKLCWQMLNFARRVVMNIVFLFFVLLIVAVFSVNSSMSNKVDLTHFKGGVAIKFGRLFGR